uniref:Uncharacterized protein n=1 Tax=Triticum urartu TaxID=4572 RepID=A0A8R7R3V9_TRIUA
MARRGGPWRRRAGARAGAARPGWPPARTRTAAAAAAAGAAEAAAPAAPPSSAPARPPPPARSTLLLRRSSGRSRPEPARGVAWQSPPEPESTGRSSCRCRCCCRKRWNRRRSRPWWRRTGAGRRLASTPSNAACSEIHPAGRGGVRPGCVDWNGTEAGKMDCCDAIGLDLEWL